MTDRNSEGISIEMLPLPNHLANALAVVGGNGNDVRDWIQSYARAVAEHNVAARGAEIKRLRAERDVIGAEAVKYADKSGRLEAKVERLRAEVAAVWNAMPSGTRYLDPPDGGDVPLHEQVRRMADDAARAEALQEELDNRWAQGVHTCHDKCQRIACVLRRDNKRLAEALRDLLIDVTLAQSNMRRAAKTDPRWEGCAEAIQPRVDAALAALRDHDQEPANDR